MLESTPPTITAQDVLRFQLIADARTSPDGRQVVYALQRADADKNKYFANLWLVGAEGGSEPKTFTRGDHRDSSPRWSQDGRSIAFVSDRGESAQIWLIALDGGEAECLTKLEEGSIGDLEWSPDGSRL